MKALGLVRRRVALTISVVALLAVSALLAAPASASGSSPGIGASYWGGAANVTVTAGTSTTVYMAFFSTGPAETATVSSTVPYATPATTTVSLPAKPATSTCMTAPNGVGGTERLCSSHAYVFVPFTINPPSDMPAGTYSALFKAQVNLDPSAGINLSPGAGITVHIRVSGS